ncbi:MAG: FHA domain-containing protein, partial [Gemmatimonadetes bacterium]|nr:FHA domain-containing protein [Gemmatimonadota bacterium]
MTPDSTPVIKGPFPPPESGDPGGTPAAGLGGDAVILHLTGPHRGSRQHLTEARALVGTAREAVVHFPVGADPAVGARHAVLVRGDGGWSVLEVDGQVYLNSADVPGLQGRETLVPGDILEIGTGGPVIRFVMQTANPPPYKSMKEAWRDCVDCARHGRGGLVRRFALFLGTLPGELLTRTSPRTRAVVGGAFAVLLVTAGALVAYGLRLESRIDAEEARSARVAEALAGLVGLAETDPELRGLVAELQEALTGRIEALEEMS